MTPSSMARKYQQRNGMRNSGISREASRNGNLDGGSNVVKASWRLVALYCSEKNDAVAYRHRTMCGVSGDKLI